MVPCLASLRFEVEERYGSAAMKHVRRIVVDRAPALFLVPCGDPRCIDGEHDLTAVVMKALRAREQAFHGTDECTGALGSAYCSRVLHFNAIAEYGPAAGLEVDLGRVRASG